MWFNVALVIFLLMNFFIIIVCLGTILNNQKRMIIALSEIKQFTEVQLQVNQATIEFLNTMAGVAKAMAETEEAKEKKSKKEKKNDTEHV